VDATDARAKIALATLAVRDSGVVKVIDELFRSHRGGPRVLTLEGFLVVLILTLEGSRSLQIRDLAATYAALPERVRRSFVRLAAKPTAGRTTTLAQEVYHMWARLGHVLDDSPVTRPWLLPDERRRVRDLRCRAMDMLAAGFLPALFPYDVHSVDATAIHTAGNPRFGGDPHARRGHKSPTDGDPTAWYFGFKLIAVTVLSMLSDGPKLPFLVYSHETVPATADEGRAIPLILARHRARFPLRYVVTDRLPSHSTTYCAEVMRIGGIAVNDLHPDLLGQHGTIHGGLWIDNHLWCPHTPAVPYWKLSLGRRGSPEAEAVRRAGQYREAYACKAIHASVTGGAWFLCPLRAGTLGGPGQPPVPDKCPIAGRDPRPDDVDPHTLCGRDTGVHVDLLAGGQPTWAGRTFSSVVRLGALWFTIYQPARPTIENVFSTATTPRGQNLHKGQHPATGLPNVALLVAAALQLHNRHRIRTWWRRDVDPSQLPAQIRQQLRDISWLGPPEELRRAFDELFPE
jgi:hypothetical protein